MARSHVNTASTTKSRRRQPDTLSFTRRVDYVIHYVESLGRSVTSTAA